MIGVVVGLDPLNRDSARRAAAHELSKGIYHRNDEPWPLRVFNAIQHWIGRVFDNIGKHAPGGGIGAFVLLLAVVVLVGIAWWRVGPIQRDRRVGGAILDSRPATAADHLREAEEAAAAGRWEVAVAARMRALALALEDSGLVDPRPGRTADELAREVAAAVPTAAGAIDAAATTFDAVVYGSREATADSYAVVVRAAEALWSVTGGRGPRVLVGRGT